MKTALGVSAAVIASFALGGVLGWQVEASRAATRLAVLPHSEPAGAIDSPSRPLPPYQGSTPLPPVMRGVDAQADARTVLRDALEPFIRTIRSKTAFRNSPTEFSYFTAPRASDSPGLCEAWQIIPLSAEPLNFELERRFIVAGSFEPPPKATGDVYLEYKAWKKRRDENCALRNADESWFYVRGEVAPQGPRLLDGAVTAARREGTLPFAVTCENPKASPTDPMCADPRKALAGIDPRDIGSINEETLADGNVMRRSVRIETRGENTFKNVTIVEEWPNTSQPTVIKPAIKSVKLSSGWRIIN